MYRDVYVYIEMYIYRIWSMQLFKTYVNCPDRLSPHQCKTVYISLSISIYVYTYIYIYIYIYIGRLRATYIQLPSANPATALGRG